MKKIMKSLTVVSLCTALVFSNALAIKASADEHEQAIDNIVNDWNNSISNGTITPDLSNPESIYNAINNGVNNANANNPTPTPSTAPAATNGSSSTSSASTEATTGEIISLETTVTEVSKSIVFSSKSVAISDTTDSKSSVYLKSLSLDVKDLIKDKDVSVSYLFTTEDKIDQGDWNAVNGDKISIKQEGTGSVYLKFTKGDEEYIVKTNDVTIDKTKPVIKGVTTGKIYTSSKTVTFTDKVSGVKKATLNGKSINISKDLKITKKGTHTLVVYDNAGNSSSVKFKIK